MSIEADKAHARVIDLILAIPKGSQQGNDAHLKYQEARLAVRSIWLQQVRLLKRALALPADSSLLAEVDAQTFALDLAIADLWTQLEALLARREAA